MNEPEGTFAGLADATVHRNLKIIEESRRPRCTRSAESFGTMFLRVLGDLLPAGGILIHAGDSVRLVFSNGGHEMEAYVPRERLIT